MDSAAYLFENLQKMHKAENKTKSLKENKSIKRKMVKESYDFKNALDDNMGITTLDELQDTYENVTDELEKALNLKSNQIVSLTEEDLDAVINDVDEETLDEITNLFSKVNSAKTIKTIIDEDMDLNIEIKNIDGKLFGYENLDGLSAIWFDVNYLNEAPFKNNSLKENKSLKESENKDLDSTISRIKARTATNESCDCEDKNKKEELNEGCNKKKTLKEDIQLHDSIAGFIDYYQLGAEDVVTAYDNYYSIDEIHDFQEYLGQEYNLDLEDYLDESCKTKKKSLKESLETIDEMTFEYMKDAIDTIQSYFNKNGVLTDELKELVSNAYTTLDKAYEIADLDLMNESCKAKKECDEPKDSKKKELEECLARIDGATLNKLVTEFVKNNYKNIDKIVFSKSLIEKNQLKFRGKIKQLNGKVENIELTCPDFSKELLKKESFTLAFIDTSNQLNILKESKVAPITIDFKNVNNRFISEAMRYNFITESTHKKVSGRIKIKS